MGQVKISKLVLEIGSKKIELTTKQAKELSEVLNEMFDKSEVVFRDRWYSHGYTYRISTLPAFAPPYRNTWCDGTGSVELGATSLTDLSASTTGVSFTGQISGEEMRLTAN